MKTFKEERITCQKKIILDYLKNAHCHPSAEKVFKDVEKKLPRISKGTVYRVLNNLKEKEKIRVLTLRGFSRYDGDVSQHSHFVCQKCKIVFDVFNFSNTFKNSIKNKKIKVGKINNYEIFLYGICKKCSKDKKRKEYLK